MPFFKILANFGQNLRVKGLIESFLPVAMAILPSSFSEGLSLPLSSLAIADCLARSAQQDYLGQENIGNIPVFQGANNFTRMALKVLNAKTVI